MISTAVLLTLATGVGMAWYASLAKPAIKAKFNKLFKDADLCKKVTIKQAFGPSREQRRYPEVQRIDFYEGYTQVIFSIPDGMNPKEITDRHWLFEQGFGSNFELSGSSKMFNLLLFEQALKPFEYNAEEIKEAIKGYSLPILAGKNHKGYVVFDMVDDPHILIAGETGSGKSVQLRSIVTTLVINCKNVELYLGDLKRSEFHLFRGIAKTVDVEPTKLHATLLHIKREMIKRGNLLDSLEVAHINDIPAHKRPNYIVVAIDEVSLLKKDNDIMEIIEQISSIGRALGCFILLSMQRPDADVLDGKLKNNLTVRMAFRHRDAINSRISLGDDHAATIQKSAKGRHYLALDEIFQVQAPHLTIGKAKELLKPFKNNKAELKQNNIITDIKYEVLEPQETLEPISDDIADFGGYDDHED